MKAYILSEEDIQKLKDRMELEQLREYKEYDPELRMKIDKFHRRLHYVLYTWINEVTE